jgi:hypothetical protein
MWDVVVSVASNVSAEAAVAPRWPLQQREGPMPCSDCSTENPFSPAASFLHQQLCFFLPFVCIDLLAFSSYMWN